jgi:hypothetical protein
MALSMGGWTACAWVKTGNGAASYIQQIPPPSTISATSARHALDQALSRRNKVVLLTLAGRSPNRTPG